MKFLFKTLDNQTTKQYNTINQTNERQILQMIISNYKYQQIRKAINSGSNQYRIVGKTGTAARYYDSPNTYYYIIDDCENQTTDHYPVDSVSKKTQAKWDKLAQQ